jgi:hypothetical protein
MPVRHVNYAYILPVAFQGSPGQDSTGVVVVHPRSMSFAIDPGPYRHRSRALEEKTT